MRWSKLRHLVKERFAEELQGRLDINSAAYGNCSCGHAWLTWDGEVIANFCTRAFGNVGGYSNDFTPLPAKEGEVVRYGEFSRQNAYEACWEFVHELSIEEALADNDPLVNFLAIADARFGKRRMAKLDPETLHPLVRTIYGLRMQHGSTQVAA